MLQAAGTVEESVLTPPPVCHACRLTDVRRLQAAEKRRAPFERRLHAALRVFERYQAPEAAEALCGGMFLEAQLRSRIDALKELRRLGARTFTSGELIQVRRLCLCCPWPQSVALP